MSWLEHNLPTWLIAVLIIGAFVVVSVQDLVSQEASSIGALYRDVTSLPEPPRGELQRESASDRSVAHCRRSCGALSSARR